MARTDKYEDEDEMRRSIYGQGETHRSVFESAGLNFLLSNKGTAVPLTHLEGKTICLFFSANWSRPCQTFTNRLLDLHNSLLHHQNHNCEIIFISFDKDENSFSDHINSMPWLIAPFDPSVRTRLCHRYGIQHIPSLIPLACDGSSVQEDATHLVDEYGVDAFPFGFRRRRELEAMDEAKHHGNCKLQDLLAVPSAGSAAGHLIDRHGTQVPITDLVGTTIGLYFGANWCPPCRSFTATLKEAYHEIIKNTNKAFEIIFISTDRDEKEFMSSLEELPWLAVPYYDCRTRYELNRIFNVKAIIPTLVLLGSDGNTLSTDGRAIISNYGAMAFPFTESRAAEVKLALRKQGEELPSQVRDSKHEHILKLDMAKAYVCDVCGRRGRHWVYSCGRCNFDLHPACVQATTETLNYL